jgi:hypothetical protein
MAEACDMLGLMQNTEIDLDCFEDEEHSLADVLCALAELTTKVDMLLAAQGGKGPVSDLGQRVRREIDRHAEDPDRCIGSRWLGRLLGVGHDKIEVELRRMVDEGALYARSFYKGHLYYRVGHGPAVRAAKVPRADARYHERVCNIVRRSKPTSQERVDALLRQECVAQNETFDRRSFWRAWSDLRQEQVLVKGDDGIYTIQGSAK